MHENHQVLQQELHQDVQHEVHQEVHHDHHEVQNDVRFESDGVANDAGQEFEETPFATEIDPLLAARLQQIEDYRLDNQGFIDPRSIVLRHIGADMMDQQAKIAASLGKFTSATPLTIENMGQLSSSLNFLLRFSKTALQATQIEVQLTKRNG